MNLAAGAVALLLLAFAAIAPILGWLARRAVVTTRRVIVHHGFFVRHRTEVSLARVREVRSKQNPVQRLWGSGDIDLYVGAEATRIPDAPGLKALHAALQELSERSYDEQVRASGYAGGFMGGPVR
uniref:PH domain-containing protein n=1 Tax=Leucobacter sp. BZR 635 TaxID=3378705 RepID=UPI003A85EE07